MKLATTVLSLLAVTILALSASAQIPAPPTPPPAVNVPVQIQAGQSTHPRANATYYVQSGAGNYFPQVSWAVSGEEANLAHEGDQLGRQLAEAKSDSDRDKIKAKLSDLLEKQFDLRQKRHESEIEALEAQVKKLKDLVQKRQENRRDIISKRLDQVVRDAQGLGW